MPQVNVIRWRDGEGWIILAGGGDPESEEMLDITAQALGRIRYGEPVAYVFAAGDIDAADEHLVTLDDLGAPTGYLVDVITEDDETIKRQITEAGMVVIGDGPEVETLRSAMLGAAQEALNTAHERGAVILGIGAGAAVLGAVIEGGKKALNVVELAVIVPHYDGDDEATRLRAILDVHPESYGIGIGTGSALALGPTGEVGAWGLQRITITLGRNATQDTGPGA
jgi:hypothetical protein